MYCFRDATRCAASVANLRQTDQAHLKVAVSGRVLDQQPTIAFVQHYKPDARCLAQECQLPAPDSFEQTPLERPALAVLCCLHALAQVEPGGGEVLHRWG